MSKFYGKALVIENSAGFLEKIKESSELLEQYPIVAVRKFAEAMPLLKLAKHQIRVVFISSSISSSRGIDELKEIRTFRPNMPVYFISHDPQKDPPEIFDAGLGLLGILKSPKGLKDITDELDKFFAPRSWSDTKDDQSEMFSELSLAEDSYIPTPISDFIETEKSFFNVYIKIGQSKFIKVLNVGDSLEFNFLEAYAKKGVKLFYISEEEHNKYLQLCEQFSQLVQKSAQSTLKAKTAGVLNFGANISRSIMLKGVTAQKLDMANSFLNQSVALVRSMRIQNRSFKKLLEIIESKEHSSTVAFLAGMIAQEVGLESDKSVKLVGLASLVHDIGLYDLDPDFKEEVLDLTPEQDVIYQNHAKHGAEILMAFGSFEEAVIQAVEQHHIRRRGGPAGARNLNLVTEIIGVADEIQHRIVQEISSKTAWEDFASVQLKQFSPQVEKAVLKLLKSDDKK